MHITLNIEELNIYIKNYMINFNLGRFIYKIIRVYNNYLS